MNILFTLHLVFVKLPRGCGMPSSRRRANIYDTWEIQVRKAASEFWGQDNKRRGW